ELREVFLGTKTLFLFMTFSSDWLYPPQQLKEVAHAVRRVGGDATYCEINSDYGHDAFLLEHATQAPLISSFLERASGLFFEGDGGEGI
ncbi:MAG: homoserine O-acetyltransferase, partial [Candidatus Sumerlaeaceae bacterium]